MSQFIKAIIGLGNPGSCHSKQRHNIGFRIVDKLACMYEGTWKTDALMALASITIQDHSILLVKPQTYMNDSGKVMPFLQKKGIKPEEILVVHDELEKPFGSVAYRMGGSARGHNGLRSIIATSGTEMFGRLRIGIGRPDRKEEVPVYVLQSFAQSAQLVEELIDHACYEIIKLVLPHAKSCCC